MKRSRLSYDEWKCILKKNISEKCVNDDFFKGYIGFIEIREVDEPQVWRVNAKI